MEGPRVRGKEGCLFIWEGMLAQRTPVCVSLARTLSHGHLPLATRESGEVIF